MREDYDDGTDSWWIEYTYDDVGNRLTREVGGTPPSLVSSGLTSYSYDDNDRLQSIGVADQEWDDNGNLTNDDNYHWDDENRLLDADGSWAFTYDTDGLKQSSTAVGEDAILHVVDTTFPHAQVIEDRGEVETRYLRGLFPVRMTIPGVGSWWYIHDALGSTRALISVGGSPIVSDEWDFEGFGAAVRELTPTAGGDGNRWLFAGEERLNAVAIDYLRARWLHPGYGIMLATDPARGNRLRPSSLNDYLYVEGSPVEWTDPSGEVADLSPGGLIGLMREAALYVSSRGAAARAAFSAGGAAIGRFFNDIGYIAQQYFMRATEYFPRIDTDIGYRLVNNRAFDYVINSPAGRFLVECKYRLPVSGEPLARLAAQLQGMVQANDGRVVVWSLRLPALADQARVLRASGLTETQVLFVGGVDGLAKWFEQISRAL